MGRPRTDIPDALAAKVATLYFEADKTHDDIGETLGLSRWKVARILQHAKDAGIVRIQVVTPTRRSADLEHALAKHGGLEHVIVIEGDGDDSLDGVAQAAADHLGDLSPGIRTLGMSWGNTLTAIATKLSPRWATDIDVVQINGGMSMLDTAQSASWAVAVIADKAHGRAHVMPTPAIVHHLDTATALAADPSVRAVIERAHQADAVVFTAGVATTQSAHVKSGSLTADQVNSLRSAGAVGDIIGRFVDSGGELVDSDLDNRTLGITLDDLVQLPQRILVAATVGKTQGVVAGLRRGLATTLIVDSALAHSLLARISEEKTYAR